MKKSLETTQLSTEEIKTLQDRIIELEQTLNAIQRGEVDALMINSKGEMNVFTIEGSDEPYRMLIESMSEGAITLDQHGVIIHCNKRFSDMIGGHTQDIIGTSFFDCLQVTDFNSLSEFITGCKTDYCKRSFKLRNKTNSIQSILLSCQALQIGSVEGISIVVTDVTELVKTQDAMQHLASFDPLTQLPNRFLFEAILEKSLATANRNQSSLALMYIDIDFFKNVNDLFGHEIGDLFLKQVSDRLKENVRLGDFVARLGGDEFAIIFENMGNVGAISLAAEHLIDAFTQIFEIKDYDISSTISIGISICPSEETTAETVMQHADQALYQAKRSSRNCYKFYNSNMQQQLERYMMIVSHLRYAIKNNELELYYQPKIDASINSIVGVEALLRWRNPSIGVIFPEEFICISEETGLIAQIGSWVINNALEQYAEWSKCTDKMRNLQLSINISASQMNGDDSMIKRLSKRIKKIKIPVENILLEVTETAMMKKALTSESILEKKLTKLGIGISIDDFGTGYSSLTYLNKLPVKELKIDKSFIDGIGKNKSSEVIIIAIITLAKNLNLTIVAEGVETKKQLDFLIENNCNIIQGYYFSKPLNASDMLAYIIEGPKGCFRTNNDSSVSQK